MSYPFGVVAVEIANQSLDAIGWMNTIGDLQEGSKEARIILRNYAPTVEEIMRSAHWNCCRKQAQLILLQDATGQTPNVGTGTIAQGLWTYMYAWPIDALQARYLPFTGFMGQNGASVSLPPTPLYTGQQYTWGMMQTVPAPFLVTVEPTGSASYPPNSWSQYPDLSGVQGQGFNAQKVILTNQQYATLVYTALIEDPNMWDPLLRQAVIQLLGAKLAMPLWAEKNAQFGQQRQGACIEVAKRALDAARQADGNEAPSNINKQAQWIAARHSIGGYGLGGNGAFGWGADYDGPGYLWCAPSACPFPNGAVY